VDDPSDPRDPGNEETRSDAGPTVPSQPESAGGIQGKRLGDFELIRELGRGGMGIVYEACQISLKRRVALKVLPPALGMTGQAKQRFEREARAAAKLQHTNIVPVHAIGAHEGHHFYAMELIDGQSLDHVLRDMVDEVSGRDNRRAILSCLSPGETRTGSVRSHFPDPVTTDPV